MFCKHCGKNIYDLEKCPFCNDGEKAENDEPQNSNPTDGKTELEVIPKEESAEVKNKATESTAKVKKNSFFEQLCKENKLFKFLNSFEKAPQFIIKICFCAMMILSVILMLRSIEAGDLLFELVKMFWYVDTFAPIIVSILMTPIFIVQMKKKNPSNELLFNGVCPEGEFEYSTSSNINKLTWQGISVKYCKASFVLSIFDVIFDCVESGLLYILVFQPMFNDSYNIFVQYQQKSIISTFFAYFKGEVFTRENLGIIITIIVLFVVKIAVIDTVQTKMHKKIAKRYQANELQ